MSNSPAPRGGTPWMPVTAGTLTIILGAVQLFLGLLIIGLGAELSERGFEGLGVVGLPFVFLGLMAIVGGIFGAVRRVWPVALIGAIAASVMPIVALLRDAILRSGGMRPGTIAFLAILIVCGVSAIVLTVTGHKDFK